MVRSNFTCVGDEDCLSMCQSDEQVGICQSFAAVTCHRKDYMYLCVVCVCVCVCCVCSSHSNGQNYEYTHPSMRLVLIQCSGEFASICVVHA